MKVKIDKAQPKNDCRLYGQRDEMVNHISEYNTEEQKNA